MFRLKSELSASFHCRHLMRDETPGRAWHGGLTDGIACPRAGGGMAWPVGTPFNIRVVPACASPFKCICHVSATIYTEGPALVTLHAVKAICFHRKLCWGFRIGARLSTPSLTLRRADSTLRSRG